MKKHAKAPSVGSTTRSGGPLGLYVLFAMAVLFALPSSASASPVYVPAGSLDGSATAHGSFGRLLSESVAVNGKNGHILVADSELGIVYDYASLADTSPGEWDGSATPAGSFGGGGVAVAADDATGDVYVADATHAVVDKFDESGALIASFGDTTPSADGQLAGSATPAGSFSPAASTTFGIAVDQATGDLYVIDAGHEMTDVFDSSGAYQSQFGAGGSELFGGGGAYADGIAVNDANSHLYISDSWPIKAFEFDLSGTFLSALDGSNTPAGSFGGGYVSVAADNGAGRVYVADTTNGVVDAFDQSGAYERQVSALGEPRGLAVEQSSGKLFVSDNSAATVRVFELAEVLPPTIAIDPVGTVTATIAILTGHINPGGTGSAYDTHWQFQCTPACPGAEGNLAADSSPHEVQAEATGLTPGVHYEVSLVAENAGGEGTPAGPVGFTTEPAAPKVDRTFVSEVTATGATLNAEINPGGAATTYHFEYVTEQRFHEEGESFANATQTPVESLTAEDDSDHLVSATISGLELDTAYRYRAVATNSAGSGEGELFVNEGTPLPNYRGFHTFALPSTGPGSCPNEQFREEQHATFLPDCRAYEQVSPVDKNGGDVIPNETRVRSSADGNRAIFASLQAFGDAHGIGVTSEYMALRDPATGAWSSHSISPRQDATGYFESINGLEPYYTAFSADLSKGVLSTLEPLSEAPNVAGSLNLYRRDDLLAPGLGSYQLLTDSTTAQPPSRTENIGSEFGFWEPVVAAASADFSHILFESRRNLTADTTHCFAPNPDGNCPPLLYESVGGSTRYVGYVPAAPGATECTGEAPACAVPAAGSQAGRGAESRFFSSNEGTLSSDGSRAIFTVPTAPRAAPDGALYLRDDRGTSSTADDTTVQIDAPEGGSGSGSTNSTFWAASSGVDSAGDRAPIRVFFTSSRQLTPDDTNPSADAYMWSEQADGEGHHLTRLSVDSEPGDNGAQARVEGIIGASEDGSYVYFVTVHDQLVAGGPTGSTGGPAGGGEARIFVWHGGAVREIGAVNKSVETFALLGRAPSTTSRLTPDGTHLAFITEGTDEALSLYGHPEPDQGSTCPSNTDPECSEVYIYDATANGGAGDLRCASCDPSGAPATADAGFRSASGSGGFSSDTSYQNHALSDGGRYVFFNTTAALIKQDTNGQVDAYEYDNATGQVHLISSGVDPTGSAFLDASPDGHDVLLATRQPLRGADRDRSRDLYDARIGGGSAEPAPAPAPCDPAAGACQPVAAAPPPSASPQSDRASGGGNVKQPRKRHCAKRKAAAKAKGRPRCRKHRKHRASHNRRTAR